MAEREVQRRLAAILAADVAGYTRLMEDDTNGTVAAWQDAREEVIKPKVAEYSGTIVKLTGAGLAMTPTAAFEDYGTPDVLFVPGGPAPAILGALGDAAPIDYVAAAGSGAQYVTSVCTGAMILGAAGLLKGKRAATHWMFMDQLPLYGAEPVQNRVVEDGNTLTDGGVTAGTDFGLTLLARLLGDDVARHTQLLLEYDPAPPFDAGAPDKAGEAATRLLRRFASDGLGACRQAAIRIGRERLGIEDG